MSRPISGRQCLQARNLLRWNQRDLASRCRVNAQRIESFEKGVVRLQKGEMDVLMAALRKQDIKFKENFEVILDKRESTLVKEKCGGTYDMMSEYVNEIVDQRYSCSSD